ncbi:MAG: hypothetical protein QM638_01260 [Nocardioides sp.]|uniref:hypothetical protein n=1 Tax=Nocardioides sp. TaxID=35761 RepID=UPI0039E59CC9
MGKQQTSKTGRTIEEIKADADLSGLPDGTREVLEAATTVPAGVKMPADRKPKRAGASDPDQRVVTIDGHDYTILPEAADDFELLDDLARIDDEDATRIPSVLRRLLGAEQMRVAMRNLRDPETGRVGVEAGVTFVAEVIKGLDPNS